MNTNQFQFSRILLLMKNDLFKIKNKALYGTLSMAGVLLFLFLLSGFKNGSDTFFVTWYGISLFLGGSVISAKAFTEIHEKDKSYDYFMLPASQLEKFTSKLLLTSIGFVVVSMGFMLIVSLAGSFLYAILFGISAPVFNPFSTVALYLSGIYIITQGMFLFASVFFKRHALFKIVLANNVLGILILIITFILFRLVFGDYISLIKEGLFDFNMKLSAGNVTMYEIEIFFMKYYYIMKFLAIYIITPYFWILTYFKLKESEV